MSARRYLMCRPTHFAVTYRINPWMDPSAPYDTSLAIAQWTELKRIYEELGHQIELIEPVQGLPDMVFAANGATVIDGKVLTVQFRDAERADEAPAYRDWLLQAGFDVHDAKTINEGEGDILKAGDFVLAGTGFRTSHASHAEVQELFGRPVITLQLVDPRFYHLDTALAVLSHGDDGAPVNVAYLPEAFSPGSQAVLRQLFPDAVIANVADAEVLGLNAVSDGETVVLPVQATHLASELERAGYKTIGVDVSELRLAGGGPKCCTLELRS
ncbi:N-dimethylarginine dimethylaminohydrolase [Allocatelliglobosispora scoriae]|uniref:N-dimethylarginine dimethylaminohydrolase n=1 Tax=Allocatelliglobosispora scoriae TaxID=643052 RepID=A0A841BYN4_9ACTN|nr:dimethylargininase [Allocatelliglobosispora scoriae]MBB5871830.1 N-dimethylarginine dimethylaminohydrolase [Allocatelliglobosispora scoriae]